MSINLSPLRGIFGLPPSSHVSDTMIINSMPVMDITPCKPQFDAGLTLFRIDPDWDTYLTILKNHEFVLSQKSLKFAYIADNFPTDTFTNEYGETFLQSFTDIASSGVQQIVQMSGERDVLSAGDVMGKQVETMGTAMGGTAGDIISGAGKGAQSMVAALNNLKNNLAAKGETMKDMVGTIDKLIGGARVDYPQIWKNSGYTPSYTATIRLYNPNPGNINSTRHHIIGPLAAILCLACPRSQDSKTYNWPFFHKIKTPGVYNLDPAVITNVTVVKGGDQQQISFNKRLAMLDVRIDFTSLYGSMVLEEDKIDRFTTRPTVRKYLDSLEEANIESYYKRNEMLTDSANLAGVNTSGSGSNSIQIAGLSKDGPYRQDIIAKNEAIQRRQKQVINENETITGRVSNVVANLEGELIVRSPKELVTTNA
jgi:hypothetical protein